MDPETGTFVEPLRKVASGLGGSSPEGPHFYKIGDYYYIMSAGASAKVNFIPKVENEEAGLVVRADDKNHYDLLITERNGQRVAMIRNDWFDFRCLD